MKKFEHDGSTAFVNYVDHTNSSVKQGVVFTSVRSDSLATIMRNRTVLCPQQPNAKPVPSR